MLQSGEAENWKSAGYVSIRYVDKGGCRAADSVYDVYFGQTVAQLPVSLKKTVEN